jgi:DNA primase
MARYNENQIQMVKAAADIVSVVSSRVDLKVAGRYMKGLCPFHNEKTPSFFVDPERQSYRCFGCGRHGDVFSFIMETDNEPFTDVLRKLAKQHHIALAWNKGDNEQEERRQWLYKANKQAMEYYQYLLETSPAAGAVRDYLASRNVTIETRKALHLGYAANEWQGLLNFIPNSGVEQSYYTEVGLIMRSKNDNYYDRFRNRLIFPIINAAGNVAGFGARALQSEDHPKYLNSPESDVYKKKNLLYGLFDAAATIRRQGFVIFVEGYMDFLRLYQAGVKNVVATSGTALTDTQAQLISRYTKRVYFCYDSDQAGINATVKSSRLLLANDIDLQMIMLPKGEDPDSYVQKNGIEKFQNAIAEAPEFTSYLIRYYRSRREYDTMQGKTMALRHIVSLIALIPDRLKQDFCLQDVARKMEFPESKLRDELTIRMRENAAALTRQNEKSENAVLAEKDMPLKAPAEPRRDSYLAEVLLLIAVLRFHEHPHLIAIRNTLRKEWFAHADTMALATDILNDLEENGSIDILTLEERHQVLLQKQKDKSGYVENLAAGKEEQIERFLGDLLNGVQKHWLERRLQEMHDKLQKTQPGSDDYRSIGAEISSLHKEKQNLS